MPRGHAHEHRSGQPSSRSPTIHEITLESQSCLLLAFGLPLHRPAICTSAERAPRFSTGSSCGVTAACSCCASRTPTSSDRRRRWSRDLPGGRRTGSTIRARAAHSRPGQEATDQGHGATSVIEYAREGYLAEAMVNFLALLGWSPGTNQELMRGCARRPRATSVAPDDCKRGPRPALRSVPVGNTGVRVARPLLDWL